MCIYEVHSEVFESEWLVFLTCVQRNVPQIANLSKGAQQFCRGQRTSLTEELPHLLTTEDSTGGAEVSGKPLAETGMEDMDSLVDC